MGLKLPTFQSLWPHTTKISTCCVGARVWQLCRTCLRMPKKRPLYWKLSMDSGLLFEKSSISVVVAVWVGLWGLPGQNTLWLVHHCIVSHCLAFKSQDDPNTPCQEGKVIHVGKLLLVLGCPCWCSLYNMSLILLFCSMCASVAAHYELNQVFDKLIISLCKFTTLLNPPEVGGT